MVRREMPWFGVGQAEAAEDPLLDYQRHPHPRTDVVPAGLELLADHRSEHGGRCLLMHIVDDQGLLASEQRLPELRLCRGEPDTERARHSAAACIMQWHERVAFQKVDVDRGAVHQDSELMQ